jgi:hypothetical protein
MADGPCLRRKPQKTKGAPRLAIFETWAFLHPGFESVIALPNRASAGRFQTSTFIRNKA